MVGMNSDEVMCPVHSKPHSLNACREFSKWEILKRREFLKKKGICFKCCETNSHLMKDCKQSVRCAHCQSVKHSTAMQHLKHIPFFFRNSCRFRISHFENSLHAFKECGFECTGHITSSEFQFASRWFLTL
jgi:hypothetical protein